MISVERLKAGDEMAFRHLFDDYYQALCLFAVDYLGDDAEAADVVQECFIKYWAHRTEFDHLMKIRAFLYTVVRNNCLNILRNDRRRQKYLKETENELFFQDSFPPSRDWACCFIRLWKLFPGRPVELFCWLWMDWITDILLQKWEFQKIRCIC